MRRKKPLKQSTLGTKKNRWRADYLPERLEIVLQKRLM
jgi:hypothetical protein